MSRENNDLAVTRRPGITGGAVEVGVGLGSARGGPCRYSPGNRLRGDTLRGENPPGLIEAWSVISMSLMLPQHSGGRIPPASLKRADAPRAGGRRPGHSGGRIPPASLKRRCGHAGDLRQHHSGGRIPPASLKRRRRRPAGSAARPLRGENPPGLIEASAPRSGKPRKHGHSGGRIPPASLKLGSGRAGAPGAGGHSGGRIPPASLKPPRKRPRPRHLRPLRGENPPGLIEA